MHATTQERRGVSTKRLMLSRFSAFTKQHKRKLLFVGVAVAAGYAGYRAFATLNAEIEALKKTFGAQPIGNDAPEELLAMKLEQMFVQAQLMSDRSLLALLPSVRARVGELVPSISAAELKERVAACTSSSDKALVIQTKVLSVLLETALSLYAISTLSIAMKTTYAVAAALMVDESNDASEIAQNAESLVKEITDRFLTLDSGLKELHFNLSTALEQCLANWPIRKTCSFLEFQDLWRNVRYQIEEISANELSPEMLFTSGEAVRKSLMRHAFPFSTNLSNSDEESSVLQKRVEAELSAEVTFDLLKNLTDDFFVEYFFTIEPRFNPEKSLPLVRVVPLVQADSRMILDETSVYLNSVVIKQKQFRSYLENVAGISKNDLNISTLRILYICPLNCRESVIASALTRFHGHEKNRALEVYSCGVLNQDSAISTDLDAIESLRLMGLDAADHIPRGLRSVPRDLVFDAVILINLDANDQNIQLASKRKYVWDFNSTVDPQDAVQLRNAIDERVRQLLDTI